MPIRAKTVSHSMSGLSHRPARVVKLSWYGYTVEPTSWVSPVVPPMSWLFKADDSHLGGSAVPWYNGQYIAGKEDVVVVTFK